MYRTRLPRDISGCMFYAVKPTDFMVMLFVRQVLSVFASKRIFDRFGISLNIKCKNQLRSSVIWVCVSKSLTLFNTSESPNSDRVRLIKVAA